MQSSFRFLQRGTAIRRVLSASPLKFSEEPATLMHRSLPRACQLSTDVTTGKYAVVDHSEAYETAMQGLHGQQLALARLEGQGKDEAPFDPFLEEELAEIAAGDVDDAGEDGNIIEAEYVDDDEEEYDTEEEDGEVDSIYNRDGSLRRSKSTLATLRTGFPAGGLFAVVELGGAQHKVSADDLIVVNRLQPIETYKIGSVHTLTDVMLVGSSHMTLVGMPNIKGAEVDVMVEEITRDSKLIIFKKRRRKNSQRKNGFRRDVTLLRVLDIRMPDEHKDHYHVGNEIVEELEGRSELKNS